MSRSLDFLIGGWQLNGIYVLQGGQPFSVTVGGNPGSTRADIVGMGAVQTGNIMNYMLASDFAMPAAKIYYNGDGTVNSVVFNAPGNSARDLLRGPGSSNMDLSLFKNFTVTERLKAQFRLQAYNLTNTPHFANPNSYLGSYITGCAGGAKTCPNDAILIFNPNTQFGQITVQPNSWRQVELGLRLTF